MQSVALGTSRRNSYDGRLEESVRRKGFVQAEQERLICGDFGIDFDPRSPTTDIKEPDRNPTEAALHPPGNPGSTLHRNVAMIGAARLIRSTDRWQQKRDPKAHVTFPFTKFGIRRHPLRLSPRVAR
jgi:hypothetical protein